MRGWHGNGCFGSDRAGGRLFRGGKSFVKAARSTTFWNLADGQHGRGDRNLVSCAVEYRAARSLHTSSNLNIGPLRWHYMKRDDSDFSDLPPEPSDRRCDTSFGMS